jgi:hypothetical protein
MWLTESIIGNTTLLFSVAAVMLVLARTAYGGAAA